MPRTEVYQLRLHPSEKKALAQKAHARGLSIAQMIREDYGLGKEALRETYLSNEPTIERGVDVEEHIVTVPVTKPSSVPDAATLTARINELARTMPRANAERLARKELNP